jgi:hypothetical protein
MTLEQLYSRGGREYGRVVALAFWRVVARRSCQFSPLLVRLNRNPFNTATRAAYSAKYDSGASSEKAGDKQAGLHRGMLWAPASGRDILAPRGPILRLGPRKGRGQCPKTRGGIPRGGYGLWRSLVSDCSGPRSFSRAGAIVNAWRRGAWPIARDSAHRCRGRDSTHFGPTGNPARATPI